MIDVWPRYQRYLEASPMVTVEWHDQPTGAVGWLVINSLRGGSAGGGTRMRIGVTREEVVYLAKAMEMKFSFSGPPIGGGKSGIRFDPADPRRREVLARWFAAIRPYMEQAYGTGGDVNVDEQRDVVPLCAALGLAHPQQGVVTGHLKLTPDAVPAVIASLGEGLRMPVTGELGVAGVELSVSDMITGYGVARAARRVRGGHLDGARVTIEGFGNVGSAAALYMARMGARIVGIVDEDHGLAAPEGLDADEVQDLLARRSGREIPDHPLRRSGADRVAAYWADADLFVPAAISGSLDRTRLEGLNHAGIQTIVCGANQPFRESRLGDTRTQEAADRQFEIVPDVVGSMGMARAFHYLMSGGPRSCPEDIFEAVGATVDQAVDEVRAHNGGEGCGMLGAAVDMALDRTGFER